MSNSSRPDPFLYKTVRAEWWIEARPINVPLLSNRYGPFPTHDEAANNALALDDENLRNSLVRWVYKVVYRESPVDIDPILSSAVQGIAGLVRGWFGRTDPTNPFAPRPSGYVRMAHVEASMKQLSEVILKTFEINKENPDVPEDQNQG